MNAAEIFEAVQNIGGSLTLSGQRIQYALPDSAVWLITDSSVTGEELIRC